jgi:hypothetical protein
MEGCVMEEGSVSFLYGERLWRLSIEETHRIKSHFGVQKYRVIIQGNPSALGDDVRSDHAGTHQDPDYGVRTRQNKTGRTGTRRRQDGNKQDVKTKDGNRIPSTN